MSATRYAYYCYRFALIASLFFSAGCLKRLGSTVKVAQPRTMFASTASQELVRALHDELAGVSIAPGTLYTTITQKQSREQEYEDDYFSMTVALCVQVRYDFADRRSSVTKTFTHSHSVDQPQALSSHVQARLEATRGCCEHLAVQIVEYLEQL